MTPEQEPLTDEYTVELPICEYCNNPFNPMHDGPDENGQHHGEYHERREHDHREGFKFPWERRPPAHPYIFCSEECENEATDDYRIEGGGQNSGASYYDDNFGHYEIESEEDVEFYRDNQRASVLKTCTGCGRKVRLLPDYAYCDPCATKREQGWDI